MASMTLSQRPLRLETTKAAKRCFNARAAESAEGTGHVMKSLRPLRRGCCLTGVQRSLRLRGQNTVEYAIVIAVAVAALLTMQVYMKRAFSGRLRAAVDSVGEQYAPKHVTAQFTLKSSGVTKTESTLEQGATRTVDGRQVNNLSVMRTTATIDTPETTERTGHETVGALSDNLWE